MAGKIGVVFIVFFFGLLTCSCRATNPILLEPFESAHENQVCELCDKYASLAIDYLQDDDNQKALVKALHTSCSQIPPLEKQCLSMVDHYTQLFFSQISDIKSEKVCKKLKLCQALTPLASKPHQENCEVCHDTVSELITKLKDPKTKLKIIRMLLKECKSLNNYQDKCKKMVFEYGPLMLVDLEKFLEKKDVCSIIGVCPGPSTTNHGYDVPVVEALADS